MMVQRFFLGVAFLFFASGCGFFTTRIAPSPQYWDSAYREGYHEGIRKGMTLGVKACVRQVRKAIESDIELLSAMRQYQELVRAGVLSPAKVALIRHGPRIEKKGQVYAGSSFKVVILEPPRFVRRSFFDRILDPGNFYTVGVFETRKLARNYAKRLRQNAVSEPDEIWVMPTEDGKFAVVVRSVTGKDYSALGMAEGMPLADDDLEKRVPPPVFEEL